jgi:hypothetical protein
VVFETVRTLLTIKGDNDEADITSKDLHKHLRTAMRSTSLPGLAFANALFLDSTATARICSGTSFAGHYTFSGPLNSGIHTPTTR